MGTSLASLQSWVLLPFFLMFLAIYLLGYFIVFRKQSTKIRQEFSSCLISIFHGTPAALLGSAALLADDQRGFAAPNTAFQKLVLDFSAAYFLTDLLHYVAFYPSDVLFIAHHVATLFVVLTCRHAVSHGAFSVLVLLVLAEVTSACQNAWTLAGARRREDPFAARFYDALSPPFFAVYSVVRGFIGPYFMYRMVTFYANGGAYGLVPAWAWVSWVLVVVMAIGVSIMWISNLWIQFFRERRGKLLEQKIR
ncbi:TLC domain-containing protein At5g14285 [Vigna radiata var. radiata]|uniref:TLC domain-containing protein At5g14285 n=1 Tax=Vigna radiata var. radiata TaxID=3916 RepID=A0A1S3W0E0_VIGRR|nr:TLC domain-containing protein At5g14285 [Vigna radiata var. radiata]